MKISRSEQDGALVVSAKGKLDTYEAAELMTALMDGIEEGHRKVVVELSRVDYMGSAGLRALLGPYEEMKGKGGRLVLAAIHENVRKVLELSKFTEILEIYPDVAAAVKAVG